MIATEGRMMIKWKVSSAPTGRYRSFEKREWPMAEFAKTGQPAAMLTCQDDYVPDQVRSGLHKEITVFISDWSVRKTNPRGPSFKWCRLKKRCATLNEAKHLASRAIEAHPDFWPEGEDQ